MGARILIVEDHPHIADIERRHLEKAGYVVSIAYTGLDAVSKLDGGEIPNLLIVDLRLPDMSGLDLMARIKEKGRNIPSVIVTGAGDEKVAVSAMKLGALDYVVKDLDAIKRLPATCEEVLRKFHLAEENARLMEELKRINSELLRSNKELGELSRTDGLTGIYNRRTILEILSYECATAMRYNLPLSFGILDIDHFKAVNDTHGHLAGDAVLKQFALTLIGRLRRTDVVGRLGGEEFGIVLTGTPLDSAINLCDELRRIIEGCTFGDEEVPIRITMSAGVSVFTPDMNPEGLIDMADKGLYRAKDSGRNRVDSIQQGLQDDSGENSPVER